jgi:DNA polymerase III delta prime subunit
MRKLWVEQYRPTSLTEYVFRDNKQKSQVESWVRDGSLPHLLLSGAAGTGKTTLAKVLLQELDVSSMDVLEMNGSSQNGVEEVRDRITKFATTMGFGGMRYVLLDEADYLTPNAQAALRNVMETFSDFCRFILTCNYPTKIIPALHSRCQGFHIEKLDVTEFTARVATICVTEGVDLDLETLDTYVQATYPDLRKCINLVQQNSVDGVLHKPHADSGSTSDWMLSSIELFKQGKFREARELIVTQARPEEYDDVFRFMYRNLSLWGKTEQLQDQAIVIIRNGMAKQALCADQEINLAACLVELMMNAR